MNETSERWKLWSTAKRTAIEYLAVFIAAVSFVFTFVFSVIAAHSMWTAYEATEESEITSMYIVELHACLKSKECEIPPVPEELLQ